MTLDNLSSLFELGMNREKEVKNRKVGHAAFVSLRLAYFTQHYVLQVLVESTKVHSESRMVVTGGWGRGMGAVGL